MRVRPPKVIVTPHETNKKLENCSRHVPQLMMRGEHIVSVVIIDQLEPQRKEDTQENDGKKNTT